MRIHVRATAAVLGLTLHGVASAQSSLDQAHATVNRLLNGAGGVLVFTTGKTLESTHGRISGARTLNRCKSGYGMTNPNHPDIPQQYRDNFSDDGFVEWNKITATRVSGDHFYYDHPRTATGRQFTYHFQFASPAAAAQFSDAANVLIAACRTGEQDEQAAETAVHDPRGNTASLAIDRRNGSRYGWAVDYASLGASDARALAECRQGGSSCQIVLRFTGGCGAFAADHARGSSVYGWGTARTRGEAENRARAEARKRGGTNVVTRVWGCNALKAAGAAGTSSAGSGTERSGTGTGTGTGTGLSDEVIRRNAEAARAHQQSVDQYQKQLGANAQKIKQAIAERQAVQEAHERELAKARAARAQFERERQAYREEYKRVTGRYPDE